MEGFLISVIIPTYCPQDYLWDCLDALCRQTLSKDLFEVIVVQNGPVEPYLSVIEDYRIRHSELNLRIEQSRPAGAARARNVGLDVAEGEYIMFLDDDDYLSDECLEEMLSLVGDRNTVVCYPYSYQNGVPGVQCPYKLTEAYDYCTTNKNASVNGPARQFFSGPCMKLIHRVAIGTRRFNPKFAVGEDSLFMFLISDRIEGIRFTSKKAIYYRRLREGSLIHSQSVSHSIKNGFWLIVEYTKVFCGGNYSFYLYTTRILGAIHRILHCMKLQIQL